MPNNKNDQTSGSKNTMGNPSDREFERQGKNPSPGIGTEGQKAGSHKQGSGFDSNMDDDDMNTSGGRKGNFSDKNRDSDAQWSPGSTQSSDQ